MVSMFEEAYRVADINLSEGSDIELKTWVDGVEVSEEFIQPD